MIPTFAPPGSSLGGNTSPRSGSCVIGQGYHWRRATIEQVYLERLSALPEATSLSMEENAIILETIQEIDELLNRLPEKARNAFFMSQIDGLTYLEIAEKLGVSDRMIRKYMVQAMVLCLSVEF
jgi:RNA polymerase sigma-19 factor, ECF subfamily